MNASNDMIAMLMIMFNVCTYSIAVSTDRVGIGDTGYGIVSPFGLY